MKILWLSHLIPYPPKSGVLMRSYHLMREIARYHEVDLLAFNQKSSMTSYFESIEEGEEKTREHFSQFIKKIAYFDLPSDNSSMAKYWLAIRSLFTNDPYTINWLKSADYGRAIADYVKKKQYDVIHFDTISLASYWGPHLQIPCVLDHHNVESHMMLRRVDHEKNSLKKWYYYQEGRRLEQYEQKNLSSFEHHILCSKDDERRLLSLDKNLNTSVIPNGISLSADLPPRNPDKPSRLLFVGGLNWYPNRDAIYYFFEEVWPLLQDSGQRIVVDIVGKFPSKKILQYAESDNRIKVYGFVDDISSFYESAAIYVCPIRDGGGTKLKILDALAHRLPIVADRVACEGLDIVDGVHALLGQDPQDMAEKILSLLQNPHIAHPLQENGYRLVAESYDFTLIGRKLSDLYISLAG